MPRVNAWADKMHSLPFEALGARPVEITLSYPLDWREWVPDELVFGDHFRCLRERWLRRWGERMVGIWAKEFQPRLRQLKPYRGAPHLHLYVKLPDAVSAEDYEGLRLRTLERLRLRREFGRSGGKDRERAVAGEFGWWLRTAWAEIVRTQWMVKAHHARGVDVVCSYWADGVATTADRLQVARYLLKREFGKGTQDEVPEGFGRVGQRTGVLPGARSAGFRPVVDAVRVDRRTAVVVAGLLEEMVAEKLGWDHPVLSGRYGMGLAKHGIKAEQSWELLESARRLGELVE